MPTLEQVINGLEQNHGNTRTQHFLGVHQFAGRNTAYIIFEDLGSGISLMEDSTGVWAKIESISPDGIINLYKNVPRLPDIEPVERMKGGGHEYDE